MINKAQYTEQALISKWVLFFYKMIFQRIQRLRALSDQEDSIPFKKVHLKNQAVKLSVAE
jgi:hypothetical protein